MENPSPRPVLSELEYRSGRATPSAGLVTLIGWWCAGVGAFWIVRISMAFSRSQPWRYFSPRASLGWNSLVDFAFQFSIFVLSAGLIVGAIGLVRRQRTLSRFVFPSLILLFAVLGVLEVRAAMRYTNPSYPQALADVVLRNMWEIAPVALLFSLLMCRSVRDAIDEMKNPL